MAMVSMIPEDILEGIKNRKNNGEAIRDIAKDYIYSSQYISHCILLQKCRERGKSRRKARRLYGRT